MIVARSPETSLRPRRPRREAKSPTRRTSRHVRGACPRIPRVKSKSLDPGPFRRRRSVLRSFVFPYLGKKPITKISAQEFLAVLKRIEARGTA